MSDKRRRPAAFRVDAEAANPSAAQILVEELADTALPAMIESPPRAGRRIGWSRIFLGAILSLVSLAFGLWIDQLVRDLFARADWLGWIAIGLVVLAVLALLVMAVGELAGLGRLGRIDRIRAGVETAAVSDDEVRARSLARDLSALYASRPQTARGRAALAEHLRHVVEGRDLLILAERELLGPLDLAARSLIMDSAKRVSLVTAISPRAVVDLAFVLMENLRLLRRLADLYGGRPGTLGFLGLAGRVVTHLGITGGMAIGDTLVQQLVGQGLAARISARLGEGVVNGLLTARIGLAALDLVRPMPWLALKKPALGDVAGELARLASTSSPRET